MTTQTQIEKQNELFSLLDSYGCRFTSSNLGFNSEMAYTKNNAGGKISTTISDDIDLNDVFEEAEKIEGMVVINGWNDNGFKTAKFPVKTIIFE